MLHPPSHIIGSELNLQRMSMLAIGRTLWSQPKSSSKMKLWFSAKSTYWTSSATTAWYRIIHDFLSKLHEQTCLPAHVEQELLYVIKEMGCELFDWLSHVKRLNREYYRQLCSTYWEDIECPNSIQWTLHGTIDIPKTVEESWLRNPNPRRLCSIYNMATRSGIREELVHSIWASMSHLQRSLYLGLYNEEYAVHTYYELHREGRLAEFSRDVDHIRFYRTRCYYNANLSFNENMLLLFVSEGYTEMAKLFWSRMGEMERERMLVDAAMLALGRYRAPIRNYDEFMAKQWAELGVCLVSRMTRADKRERLLGKVHTVLRMTAMNAWPWRDDLRRAFDEFWECLENDGNFDSVLYDIAERLIMKDAKGRYQAKVSRAQLMFRNFWTLLPTEAKQNSQSWLGMTVEILMKARDFTSAQLILDTPEVASKRSSILIDCSFVFDDMAENCQFDLLDRLANDNFASESERRNFKLSLLPYIKFILRRRFDLADKCLDWQCSNKSERTNVKLSIDYREIGYYVNHYTRISIGSTFLNWQCSDLPAPAKDNKGRINLNVELDRDTIYKLWLRWKAKVSHGEDKANKFFNWFLKLEDEIVKFKRCPDVRDELVKLLTKAIIKQKYWTIVENLTYWCAMSVDMATLTRDKIMRASKIPICRYCIEIGDIRASAMFLRWIKDEAERTKFVNHFVGNKGSTSCYRFITRDCRSPLSTRKTKFRNFINLWIKPLDKTHLRKFKRRVAFQARRNKDKQPEDFKNYEIFQTLLSKMM